MEKMEQLPNIAEQLDEKSLSLVAETVIKEYDIDIESRREWDERRGTWYKLFALIRDPKSTPWPDCSNVAIPIMTTAIIQFQARAIKALFSQKNVVTCKWLDSTTKNKALRVDKYMNYQLTDLMEEWTEDMDSLLIALPLMGSCFKKTYYDSLKNRPVSRYISADDFVVPYHSRTLDDAVRKTHVLHMNYHEIRARIADKEYIAWDNFTEKTSMLPNVAETSSSTMEAINRAIGLTYSAEDADAPRDVLEQHRWFDLNNDGLVEPYIVVVDKETRKTLRIESRELKDANNKTFVMEHFTAYPFIPNPESVYGFGFGHLLGDINEVINTIINQLIDAGSLSNMQGGFYNKRSGLRSGDLNFKRGEYKPVELSVDDIRKAIMPIKFDPPSQVLFTLLNMLKQYGSELSTVSDSLVGKMPPSDTTATTTISILEQGLKVFSTIQERIHRSLKKELKKIFLINSITLIPGTEQATEYMAIQDPSSEEGQQTPEDPRTDFLSTMKVIPASDPNVTNQAERFIKAQQAYQTGMQNPMIANNPEAMYVLLVELYSAYGSSDIDIIVKKPLPPPPPPDLSAQEENAEFLKEKMSQVLPQQNHEEHLNVHDNFQNSAWGEQLTPYGKDALEAHIRDTKAALYLSMSQPPQMQDMEGMQPMPMQPMPMQPMPEEM